MKQLRENGAKRATGHDDWTFRAEWPARPDRNGGGERLEEGEFRRHAALIEKHLLHRFRDAVPANCFSAVARH